MECPACHTGTQSGQRFCGTCGHKLEKECAECGTSNPPAYNFCSGCGHNLGSSGSIALVRSGLIAEVDSKASALLGHLSEEMAGKPFSLFVAREDLAVFFSHWNELLASSEKQVLELALNHKKGKKVYVLMEGTYERRPESKTHLIHLNLNDISARRLALDKLQYQQDLLNLIYALADKVRTVSGRYLHAAIVDALKKIGLFARADRSFIYVINRDGKRLEASHQWCQPSSAKSGAKSQRVPLSMIKRIIVRLLRERSYIVGNVAKLTPSERYELLAWHHADQGAVMCHLIYARKRPVGIIGVAKCQSDEEWTPECVALVKLFGQMVSDLLPQIIKKSTGMNANDNGKAQVTDVTPGHDDDGRGTLLNRQEGDKSPSEKRKRRKNAETPEVETASPAVGPLQYPGRPMLLEQHTGDQPVDQQTVLPRDDGLIILICPHCGLRESVSMGQFGNLGNAVNVQCSCHKRFTAVLEKRRSYRKPVRLEGFFTIAGEYGPNDTKGSIWGPMVVKNISKTGLRFISKRVDLIHPGDALMVRFNLDNSNNALIHKQVQVISVHDQEVGCRFKGADQYDITLGFYFI